MQHDAAKEYLRAFCREDLVLSGGRVSCGWIRDSAEGVSGNPFRSMVPLEMI